MKRVANKIERRDEVANKCEKVAKKCGEMANKCAEVANKSRTMKFIFAREDEPSKKT